MGCNCGGGQKESKTWTVINPDGTRSEHLSQTQAQVAATKTGGTILPPGQKQ